MSHPVLRSAQSCLMPKYYFEMGVRWRGGEWVLRARADSLGRV